MGKTDHKKYHLDLPGIYQSKNLLTVLETCSVLKDLEYDIDENEIDRVYRKQKNLLACMVVGKSFMKIQLSFWDVGHNEDGIKQIIQQIELTTHHELHIIIGMVKDKEIDTVLSLLPHSANYYFTQASYSKGFTCRNTERKGRKI
jgi:dihydrofolate synthase/folylpolyglutamate synthase